MGTLQGGGADTATEEGSAAAVSRKAQMLQEEPQGVRFASSQQNLLCSPTVPRLLIDSTSLPGVRRLVAAGRIH